MSITCLITNHLHQQVTLSRKWRQVGESFKPPKYEFHFSSKNFDGIFIYEPRIKLFNDMNLTKLAYDLIFLLGFMSFDNHLFVGHAQMFHGPFITSTRRCFLYSARPSIYFFSCGLLVVHSCNG